MSKQAAVSRSNLTLLEAVFPKGAAGRAIVSALLGTALLALSAKVQVPFWPVPMTMQTMVVLLIGMAYGSRLGAATVLLYLAEGAMGLPVFAGPNAGPAYLMGPTGGYLAGFVLSAWFVGFLAERGWDRSILRATAAMALGHAVVFVPGLAWLSVLFGFDKAVALGLTPFLAATVLKTALGMAVMQAAWWGVARRHG